MIAPCIFPTNSFICSSILHILGWMVDDCPIFSLRPLSSVFLFSGSSLATCPWRCGAQRAARWARCAGRRASSTSSTATRSATWRRWSSPRPRPAPSPPPPSTLRSAGNKWICIQQQKYFQPLYLKIFSTYWCQNLYRNLLNHVNYLSLSSCASESQNKCFSYQAIYCTWYTEPSGWSSS